MYRHTLIGFGAFVFGSLLCGCNHHPPGEGFYSQRPLGVGFYSHIRIGPNYTITPEGERALFAPPDSDFFEVFYGSSLLSAEHRHRPAPGVAAQRVFYMEANASNGRLDRTVKTVQLYRGSFGFIALKKTCFYNRSFEVNIDTLGIGLDDLGGSPAEQASAPIVGTAPTSFALLRVYRDGAGEAVVTGDYEADGMLRSLYIDHTRSGKRLSYYREDGITMNPLTPPLRAILPNPMGVGIPAHIGQEFLSLAPRLPAPPLPVLTEILFTVYGDGALTRRDTLSERQDGSVQSVQTLFLKPTFVQEERQLDPACNAQFAAQRAEKKRTVE